MATTLQTAPSPRIASPAPAAIRKLTVLLAHAPNPDIRSGGYWADIPPFKKKLVPVSSLEGASRVCCEFNDKYGLGGGNWTGGEVRENGKIIACISYNGRCWTPAPWGHPDHKEIPLAG